MSLQRDQKRKFFAEKRRLAGAVPFLFGCFSLSALILGISGASLCATIAAPVLKWKHGGCYSSWCETGWYSSPAVADLDGDGTMEAIGASYSLFVLNGRNGSQKFRADPPGGRVWPGVGVADIDGDGRMEIVAAQGGGYVSVYDHSGKEIWTRQPAGNELRGLSLYDLDSDGFLDVIVTGAVYGKTNTWVYGHDGTLRSGWPQLTGDSGFAYGVFNANQAVFDLDKDGRAEIIVPSDVHYICAYDSEGGQLPASAIYDGRGWGSVGVWESPATELRGWGTCADGDPRSERYRANFAHGASVVADVDGDGALEVVAVGNVYDCAASPYKSKYNGAFLFNGDRSRFRKGGVNWRKPTLDTGPPLSEDYDEIENNQPNPVAADLDGDGKKEILFSSYDGRVHAFWLDRTEHGKWPYSVYRQEEGFYRFASEPVVADLDNDGHAEVLFASWTQKGSHRNGKLHILDFRGNPIHETDLPAAPGDPASRPDYNGALAAPTLANIDADPDLEVVVNTIHSGLVAYDLPGTSAARILWGTGRGNYQRTGTADPDPLPVVTIEAVDRTASESGADNGRFRLTRTGQTNRPLTVRYSIHGTAKNGVDYKTLSGTRVIPQGAASANITLVPAKDAKSESNETVILKIMDRGLYIVGKPAGAKVLIHNAP